MASQASLLLLYWNVAPASSRTQLLLSSAASMHSGCTVNRHLQKINRANKIEIVFFIIENLLFCIILKIISGFQYFIIKILLTRNRFTSFKRTFNKDFVNSEVIKALCMYTMLCECSMLKEHMTKHRVILCTYEVVLVRISCIINVSGCKWVLPILGGNANT